MGRTLIRPEDCTHAGPIVVDEVEGGYVALCLLCRTVGPVREFSREAKEALLSEGRRRE